MLNQLPLKVSGRFLKAYGFFVSQFCFTYSIYFSHVEVYAVVHVLPWWINFYTVEANGEIVGEGKLLCYDKSDIAHELERQSDFYCHAYLSN